MVKTAVLLVVLLLATAGQIHAADKVYKWTDENGVVHYSATPPEETAAEPKPKGSSLKPKGSSLR